MKKVFENKKLLIGLIVIALGFVAIGGWSYYKSNAPINIGHPKKGDFVIVGQMSEPRYFHEAILLDDGTVLVIDKRTRKIIDGKGVTSADIYNPETHKFVPVGNMNICRQNYSATKLKNGEILIAGGRSIDNRVLKSTEIYNPKTKSFEKGPDMNFYREDHTTTLLNDGRVLVSGGACAVLPLKNMKIPDELYNPKTEKFEISQKLNIQRRDHSAILLKDGRVLIVGGVGKGGILVSTEAYNPKKNKFELTGDMNIPRKNANIYLLNDGNVLISGGIKDQDKDKGMDSIFVREIELYNPKTSKFEIIAKRTSEPNSPAEVLLNDDTILFTGSQTGVGLSLKWYATSEIFDPATKKFTQGEGMNFRRSCHRATLLKDGNVLITGSDGKGRTAELYIGK